MISAMERRCGTGRIILSDGGGERGGGGGGKTGKSRVFKKRLQKLLCVIGRACCATFAVWFKKFNSTKKRRSLTFEGSWGVTHSRNVCCDAKILKSCLDLKL